MGRLQGTTALITGASGGIGRACALALAREGSRIAALARRSEPLETLAAEIRAMGGEALAMPADVTRSPEIEHAMEIIIDRFGPFEILINSAGISLVGTAEETNEQDWERVLAVNLTGTFLVSRAAVPVMRRAGGGSIVNIGSVYGLVARRERAAYAASKGGVTLLTRAMALDHAGEGIRVNCICPALVETELMQRIFARAPDPQAARRERIAELPLGRLGKAEDIAALAVFLASNESSWMTGAVLPLDAGLSAG